MSKSKAAGAAKRTVNPNPKYLGVKKFAGEAVQPGDIIVRQRGTKLHPGNNVGMGRDHTIFSKVHGTVSFRRMTGYKRNQKLIDVEAAKAE